MAAAGILVVLVLALALVGPFVLYLLVEREAENTRRMDRAAAERAVRRDAGSETGDDTETDPWGSDGRTDRGQ
jgi:Tfp pilus assembly protein PilX